MRILLRNLDDKAYVWQDATYRNERYYMIQDGVEYLVTEVNIAAVENHECANRVICRTCGELIENTPEAIEKHYNDREMQRDCKKCEYLTFNKPNYTGIDRKLVDRGDGTYEVTETFVSDLWCGAISYSKRQVTDSTINNVCKHFACRRNGMRSLNSVFVNYPGVFDTAITTDTLIANKFKNDGYNGKFFLYDMKSRGTIKACVNASGIVECFLVSSRGTKLYFYYSEKYDKMFYLDEYKGTYVEGCPYWFREEKFNEAREKIKALYKGAE